MNRRTRILPTLLLIGTATACAWAQPPAPAQAEASRVAPPPAWDKEVVSLFATLAVQEGGRIKPLDTLAQFTLLSMNGARTFRGEGGLRRTAMEWMLDVLFYPELARDYRQFMVNTWEAINAIGVKPHEKKRDRYSYAELQAGREKLMELAGAYEQKDAAKLSPVEQQILDLAHNVLRFESLLQAMDFGRVRFKAEAGTALAAAITNPDGVTTSEAVQLLQQVARDLAGRQNELGPEAFDREQKALMALYQDQLMPVMAAAQELAIIPDPDRTQKQWLTPGELPHIALDSETPQAELMGIMARLEEMVRNRQARLLAEGDAAAQLDAALLASTRDLHTELVARADARGEYGKIPLEVFFYNSKLLFYSQWLYVLSFVLIAISWLMPNRKWIHRITPAGVIIPTILLIAAITLRCIIRGRPPVTTLYETILFVTAIAVLVTLFMEWMGRKRIALATGAFFGMLGLFLAYRYEIKEGVDTMPSLRAVLDTNFWLATHVTTVTMGYSAGLLAGALAHIYVFGRLFGIRRNDLDFYKGVTRMVYGVLCFGILFAVVGTVLGGIWANDSWGRFWGWDPKENGALLIVLWGLILLHARLGKYIRDLGINLSAITLGMVVAFSWWGVNLLGVGLHSYGFTSGIWMMLAGFWGVEALVVALGGIVWLRDRNAAAD